MTAFHLSLPCHNVKLTGDFYVNQLGASKGRSKDKWVDINLFGHQITFTQSGTFNFSYQHYRFEKSVLPSFHFGILLDQNDWDRLLQNLTRNDQVKIGVSTFLKHESGEHQSFFIKDPNGYFVEFKTFKTAAEVFQK